MLGVAIPNSVVLGLQITAFYLAVLWLAVAFSVYRDAERRSKSWPFRILAALLGLFPPFLGTIVYAIIRPPMTLEEEHAAFIEERLLEGNADPRCPTCGELRGTGWLVCPICRTTVAKQCPVCTTTIELEWKICPFCGTEQNEHASIQNGSKGRKLQNRTNATRHTDERAAQDAEGGDRVATE